MAKFRILINAVEYRRVFGLKLTKTINRMDYLEFTLRNVSPTDYSANVKYNSQITVEEYNSTTSTYSQIFKGYIRDLKKGSYKTCVLIAHSTAIKLFDRNWTERKQFTNTASDTIFTQTVDGIMEIGTNSITDVITTRFELDNKLKSISQLTNLLGGEWWEDDTAVLADRINLAPARYSDTSVETFTAGSNTLLASDDIDYDKIFNCITVLGKGDGINQAKAQTYGFCEKITTVSVAITSTATSIFVTDTTGWASLNGVCYINNEKILYANRTGNNLYNCTRGYDSTTAVAHSVGIAVWDAGSTTTEYTKTSPATGSSVDIYGIKEYSYADKRIVRDIEGDPDETCSRVAKALFEKFKEPVRSVNVIRRNLLLGSVDVGKTITVVDSASGLNSDFKIQSIELHYMFKKGNKYINSLKIITNNLKFNFSTEIEELKKDIDAIGSYEQGATNIYQVAMSENIDETHPMNLRFYMPPEAVAVNAVKLNFKMKNYRADSKSVTGAPDFGTNVSIWNSGGLAFMIGDPETTTIKGISSISSNSDFIRDFDYISESGHLKNFSTIWTSWDVPVTTGMVLNKIETWGYIAKADDWWYDKKLTQGSTYSLTSVIKSISKTETTAITGIIQTVDNPITSWTSQTWDALIDMEIDVTNPTGTYDKTKMNIAIYNGDTSWKTATLYLKDGGDILQTLSVSIASLETQVFNYEFLNDIRGKKLKLWINTTDFNVNRTTRPDTSTIIITTTTFIKTTNDLDYGIYENTAEFTPPGTLTVKVGEDGESLTEIGTYSANQNNLSLSDNIDFEKNKWYNVEITPSTTGCPGGRMRIEANAYVQIYIESD